MRIFPIRLLGHQDLYNLYACAALLERILLCPIVRRLGVELLDLNYANIYQQTKAELLKFSKVFGLAFLDDGATIH